MEGEKEFNKGYEDARKDFIDGKSATLQLDGYKSELYCDGYQTATEDFKKLMRHHMPPEIQRQIEGEGVQAGWWWPW